MKHKLVLSLTADRLGLGLVQCAPARGLPDLLRQLLRRRSAPAAAAPQQVLARTDVTAPVTPATLVPALLQAMMRLKAMHPASLAGIDLEVQLGMRHARLGLLVLADSLAASPSASTCEAYAQAWARQMWRLDPQQQIMRWEVLDDMKKILISSTDRQLLGVLDEFSRQQGLRFVSCKPAVLCALRSPAQPGHEPPATGRMTLVWTEAGRNAQRASNVQMLRFEGAQLTSIWRGWVTPQSDTDQGDDALEGALRRFQAHQQAQAGDELRRLHWPTFSADAAAS